MGISSLRSLLLAAIVLSNCITWTASRHHYTHNVNGHRSRHRRQGAGLFLPASYVIPGGEGRGVWGEWGEVSPCSRTCGGGVASQKRICLEVGPDGQPLCTGGDTKYFSCQTQDCPEGSGDFRAEQCAEFNDKVFRDQNKYSWVPYTKAHNPCELNCMPRGERFYYRQRPQVVDGTRCNDESFDVCVNGTCQAVGCDMMLGSNAREDKCRECRGNGTNCRTMHGLIDDPELRRGYNDVLLIPQGATNILIEEVKDSSNYLALRAKHHTRYYLNGDYHIDFPRSLMIAGALWHYERSQQGFAAPDKLRCLGPTNEPLYLSLLLQENNVGVRYEYSIPSDLAPRPTLRYDWVFDKFSPCSATCGGGFQTRTVTCRSRDELNEVDESLCEEGLKPATNQTCNTQSCGPRWVEGPWSPCSRPCGEGGTRSREVHCEKIITNGLQSVVSDKECFDLLGPKPNLYEECNGNATCPTWFTGPWKPCDKLCGEGKQTRQVVCHTKIKGRVEVFDDNECGEEKPAAEQTCLLHPCGGIDWVLSDWSGCDSCLSTKRTRIAKCVTTDREVVDSDLCKYHPVPELDEPCDKTKLPACQVQWYATQWSNCSAECGKGIQSRRVFCGLFDGASVLKVDDSRCDQETRYKDTKPCEVPKEKCPAKWFAGAWTECSKKCGGGEQSRHVMCLIGDQEVGSCDQAAIPDLLQTCNVGPCNEDEMLPVDSKSTPIMDDYEECEEEDYSEVGAESSDYDEPLIPNYDDIITESIPYTDVGTGNYESVFPTDSGSGSEPDSISYFTLSEGSGSTETTLEWPGLPEEAESVEEITDTIETGSTDTDSTVTEATTIEESTISGSTESTSSSESESAQASSTDATESNVSTETSETTVFEDVTEISSTERTETTGSTELEDTRSTEIASTDSTETSETSSTEQSEIIETTEFTEGNTEPTETSTTDITETSSSTIYSTEMDANMTESSSTMISTDETGTTKSGSTYSTDLSTTDSDATDVGVTASSTLETESSETPYEASTTESGTTETGETSETTELSSSTEIEEFGSTTETAETSSTASESTETTENMYSTTEESTISEATNESTEEISTLSSIGSETTEFTSTSESSETGSTESTEITSTDVTESMVTGLSTTEMSTEETTSSDFSSTRDWGSTVLDSLGKKRCKPRKKAKCLKSKYGCCPDNRTPATGPFDKGCPNPQTCKDTKFGCCSDGVSPAAGPENKDCPVIPCNETLYGCCLSDKTTPAEGNDQEGCPKPVPACEKSKFGCCKDGKTEAKGLKKKGCPETETEKPETKPEGCAASKFGCCADNRTEASGPDGAGCPCGITKFGCCPDGVSPAGGAQMEGCVMSCNTSAYGCCPDGQTPAHGPEHEGCCLQYAYGCCPDNYKPADGPHLEGCGCQYAHYGCCPDNVTIARGPNREGCGCQHTEFGCCPDRHTEAQGPEFKGCDCNTYQFGCCPDGYTAAKGPNLQGCNCQQAEYGCCGDGQTAARGPGQLGCDCSNSKFGCCPDGVTDAKGEKFLNCTDVPENRQAACALATDRGPCRNFSVYWFYDMTYGGCSRFWFGGCEGNGNRFVSKEECEDVCVQPAPKDACKLPKVKGACHDRHVRWYYDSAREQCSQFEFGGCLGNSNNFESRELCQKQCEPAKTEDQCILPIERGSCAGNFGRWGFDAEQGRCVQFIWGGCEGNSNRFGSEAACLQRCDPPGVPKPECSLPQASGNCSDKLALWAFSSLENRCVPFYYSGCGGNDNRFESEATCAQICPSAYVQETCALPALTGECADYTLRWFYDTSEKRCRQFYYGGCGGNDNNFLTEDQCHGSCVDQPSTTTVRTPVDNSPAANGADICFLERDPGPCTQFATRWSYDTTRGDCVPFEYGGCGGNSNNFADLQTCQYYCSQTQDVCQLPLLPGPCYDWSVHWFYDVATDTCQQFQYGGCEGNENRFDSQDACEQRCKQQAATPAAAATTTTSTTTVAPSYSIPSECEISTSLEECSEAGTVWYLDVRQRACVAHDNAAAGAACRRTGSFRSQEACERACGAFRGLNVCRYPMDPGPCMASAPKVYFDEATGRCEPFVYGGCHGGPNRFSSVQECEQVCKPESDPCKQHPEPGNCVGYYVMWYYDEQRDACGQFVYSGCSGNDNRFETQADCEGRCRRREAATARPPATPAPTTTVAPYLPPVQAEREECRTPVSLEACGENITVYYYDTRTGACVSGDVGGCGYANSYRSEEECERTCGAFRGVDVCRALLDPGPCVHSVAKVYWDAGSGRCLPFAYGGCLGGPNRFSSVQECEEVCAGTGPDAACLQAVESGPAGCGASSRRWFYDAGDCRAFVFRGCAGNANNFQTYEECAARCLPVDADNEVLPDCKRYNLECASLQCDYQMQRSSGADGCERCECVPAPVDCGPARAACEALRCPLQLERVTGADGCERCQCVDPCEGRRCGAGERCVSAPYRDPISGEPSYLPECREVNKSGSCPLITESGDCFRECSDDADCRGTGKCCARGCRSQCVPPVQEAPPTTLAPQAPLTTLGPQAPLASEDTLPEVIATEGGKATLRCLFHGNPPPSITWRRGEITIEGDRDRYRLLSDGALEIVSIYRNDSGVYICIANNELGSASQEVYLIVNVPVTTRIAAERAVVEAGAEVNIPCEVDGYPLPDVYWSKDGVRLAPTDRMTLTDARLTISGATVGDSGAYGCHASNAYSSHSSTIHITVQGLYIPAKCTDNPFFANCALIVRSKFCKHQYYSRFCCKSCVQAGQLNPLEMEMQADEAWKRK